MGACVNEGDIHELYLKKILGGKERKKNRKERAGGRVGGGEGSGSTSRGSVDGNDDCRCPPSLSKNFFSVLDYV